MTYTPHRQYENNTSIWDIREHEWANLARTEKADEEDEEGVIVEDTPLLINLKVSKSKIKIYVLINLNRVVAIHQQLTVMSLLRNIIMLQR